MAALVSKGEASGEGEGAESDPQAVDGVSGAAAKRGRGLSKARRRQLDSSLFALSASGGRVAFGLPSLQELLDRGLAQRAGGEEGEVTIPIRLGSRVSTQPGTMRLDNPAQIRAAALSSAVHQELRLPRASRPSRKTRAFNMRPCGCFAAIYGE